MPFARKRRFAYGPMARRVRARRTGSFGRRTPRRSARATQRRFTRKAGWAVGRTSQSGAVRRTGYNTRLLRLSTYRNKLWESSRFKTHYRSVFARSQTLTTPSNANQVFVQYSSAWGGQAASGTPSQSPFWTNTGGARQVPDGAFPGTADITVRGGRYYRRYTNISGTTIRVERWEIYRKPEFDAANPLLPPGQSSFTEVLGWDPTYVIDWQARYRIGRKIVNDLEPGDTFTIENKIPVTKVDQTLWESGAQRPFNVVAISSSNVAQDLLVQYWHSASFSGDRDEIELP